MLATSLANSLYGNFAQQSVTSDPQRDLHFDFIVSKLVASLFMKFAFSAQIEGGV
jgi:hypothetical protein